jgi:hypothetical protein
MIDNIIVLINMNIHQRIVIILVKTSMAVK